MLTKKKMSKRDRRKQEFEQADSLWKIWKITLHDLAEVEKSRYVRIDMSTFMSRVGFTGDNRVVCSVCAAGSVIRQRLVKPGILNNPRIKQIYLQHFSGPECVDHRVVDKLQAIDRLRCGRVSGAVDLFYDRPVCLDYDLTYFYIPDYASAPKIFWRKAKELLRLLKKHEL